MGYLETQQNRRIYNQAHYIDSLRLYKPTDTNYDRRLIQIRLDLINKYGSGKILDLCCGTGAYLIPIKGKGDHLVGLDFSYTMLLQLAQHLDENNAAKNISLLMSDANYPAIASLTFDFIFSYIALYQVPSVEKAIRQAARMLVAGGKVIFELGNQNSINARVSKISFEQGKSAESHLLPYQDMLRILHKNGFRILEHRVFQILPMWGPRTLLFLPVTLKFWKHVMGIKLGRFMLDEWISSSMLLRKYAFRHIFVCEKVS